MPRPVHAMGRPGTTVLPVDWQATHRPVVDGFHTVPVGLFHPVDDNDPAMTWDEDLEQMVPATPAPFWSGLARIQALRNMGGAREVAGDDVAVVTYQVTITAREAIEVGAGDVVRIDASYADDPLLAGKAIHVEQVAAGSLRFERLLYGQLVDDTTG